MKTGMARKRWIAMAAAGLLAVTTHADLVLSTFDGTGLDFSYGSWSGGGALSTGLSFLTVDTPATPSGGGGVSGLALLFDPSDPLTAYLSLTARLGSGNQAAQVNVVLVDSDLSGSESFVYFFQASDFNATTFETVTVPLASHGFYAVQSGTPDGILNPDANGAVTGWQLQGSYANNTDTLNWEFDNVAVIPEPGTLMLASLGMAVLATVRRFKKGC